MYPFTTQSSARARFNRSDEFERESMQGRPSRALPRLTYLAGRLPSTGRKKNSKHTDTQKVTQIREKMQLTLRVCSFSLRTGPRRKPSTNSDPPRQRDTLDTDRKNRKRV